jgi:hypothetical protein
MNRHNKAILYAKSAISDIEYALQNTNDLNEKQPLDNITESSQI